MWEYKFPYISVTLSPNVCGMSVCTPLYTPIVTLLQSNGMAIMANNRSLLLILDSDLCT